MSTVTLKINDRSKAGKLLKDFLEFISNQPGVEVINEKSPYNPEFVKKIEKSRTQKGGKVMKSAAELWESL